MDDQLAAQQVVFRRSIYDLPRAERWWLSFRNFLVRKKLGTLGLLLVILAVFCAVFAPVIDRYDPNQFFVTENPDYDPSDLTTTDPRKLQPTIAEQLEGPSGKHWLGTDNSSRDVYSRLIWGARLSLTIGLGAAAVATFFGSVLGVLSGYFLGLLDMLLQRLIDAIQAFPPLILLLLIVSATGSSVGWSIAALGFLGIAFVVRVVRSAVIATRNEVYVDAARLLGATNSRIMVRHVLPNITAPIIVIFTATIGNYIIAEALLQFFGLGILKASWGQMLNESRSFLVQAPLVSIVSGAAITLTVLGFNLLGDALRDVLDPRLRQA